MESRGAWRQEWFCQATTVKQQTLKMRSAQRRVILVRQSRTRFSQAVCVGMSLGDA
ncbi:hypothetical protein DEO72_LG9g1378 [Vigna unguiculata]|uniref:Uncharacterized protein n=1 Tax=Vigna unguiculata TaxID=3917 RepID=A0A4D6MY35_VIGUN|nr:hypothetical protein DEO72_LG9g1378 [Vigna unguiculata]